ncbi:MAG: mechanosensitive ion channel family protein [Verrucomicrobiota bacterium]
MKSFFRGLIYLYFAGLLLLLGWGMVSMGQSTNDLVTVPVPPGFTFESLDSSGRGQLTFFLDRLSYLNTKFLGIPLWQYIATLIYLGLAVFAAKWFDFLVTVQLRKLTQRTKTKIDDVLIQLLHGPLRVLALVVFVNFGFDLFDWPVWITHWIRRGLVLLIAFSITYMVIKVVDLLAIYWQNRPAVKGEKSFNELLIPLVTKTVKVFIVIMAILITLDHLHFEIRTLLAGVSISGLALGLAAQDTIGNLFGAAAVFVDKPFKLGDMIKLNDIQGVVEEIGLRSTRLRNLDGHIITVPNKTMGNATITNITRRPNIKTVFNIGLTYETPTAKIEEAVQILNDIYKSNPMTHDVIIGFSQFADSSLNISVVHWWKGLDYKEYVAGMERLNLELKDRFDKAGIGFAFPSRTVYLRQDNDWRIQAQPVVGA